MADSPEQGLATAARLSLDARPGRAGPAGAGEAPEQLDLLGLLGMSAPSGPGAPARHDLPASRPGTRAGIRNRRTDEWIEYFAARGYRSPLENLLALANLGVEELSRALRCSLLEAAQIIIRCNSEAAPYLHPKLASLELRSRGEPGGRPSTLELVPQHREFGSLVDLGEPTASSGDEEAP
jgi:hypothetical protein